MRQLPMRPLWALQGHKGEPAWLDRLYSLRLISLLEHAVPSGLLMRGHEM